MKESKKEEFILAHLTLYVVFILFTLLVVFTRPEVKDFEDAEKIRVKGVFTEERKRKLSRYLDYEFRYNGRLYEGTIGSHGLRAEVGDICIILFVKSNPDINEVKWTSLLDFIVYYLVF